MTALKRNKRITAFVLALVLLLAGCGNGQLSTTAGTTEYISTTAGTTEHVLPTDEITKPNNSADETTESTELEGSVTCQYLPKTVENPDNLPVLKWVCLTYRLYGGGSRVWNETAATELNQMLADRNMPFRVQFVLLTTDRKMWSENKTTNIIEWFTYPEAIEALADADLIYGGMNAEAMVQYLSPITEYVTGPAEPSLKNAVAHELNWMAGTVEGDIYGYDTTPYEARSAGWIIDSELLKAAGLKAEDLQRDFWDMDDILAKLYAANGNKAFLYLQTKGIGRASSMFGNNLPFLDITSISNYFPRDYENLVGFFAVDYSQKTPAIANWLETETARKVTEAVLRYAAAGYITQGSEAIRMQYAFPCGADIYVNNSNGNIYIPATNAYFMNTAPEGFISGVAAVSEHKAEAVSLLNLIAEDEAFRMQLFYGKEGRDYTVENGYYSIVIHEDGSNYSLDFLSPLAYFCGLTEGPEGSRYSIATNDRALYAQEGKTILETYREIMDQCECYYPIVFDYTGIEQELAAMQEIFFNKYDILKSQPLTEEIRQQLIQDLKAAGSDKVLAELQRQLSEWQKNNPDWLLQPEE